MMIDATAALHMQFVHSHRQSNRDLIVLLTVLFNNQSLVQINVSAVQMKKMIIRQNWRTIWDTRNNNKIPLSVLNKLSLNLFDNIFQTTRGLNVASNLLFQIFQTLNHLHCLIIFLMSIDYWRWTWRSLFVLFRLCMDSSGFLMTVW